MNTPSHDVHRLLDIVVEEVSLVDRAANQHRFLLVKRDATMSTPSAAGANKALPDSPLSAALAALESLTAIVDQLSSLGEAGSDVRLAALAEQLRSVAQELLEQTGFGESDGTDAQGVAARAAKVAPQTPATEIGDVMASTQQALAQVAELLAKAAPGSKAAPVGPQPGSPTTPVASPPTQNSSTPPPGSSPPPPSGSVPVELIQKLCTTVQALTTAVTEQHQRLGRVEKQFGLPNSVPPAERPSDEGDDVGWPMDLNAPKNRQAVDKSVSFHDP